MDLVTRVSTLMTEPFRDFSLSIDLLFPPTIRYRLTSWLRCCATKYVQKTETYQFRSIGPEGDDGELT